MTTLSVDRRVGWWRTLSTGVLAACAAALVVGLLSAYGSEQLGYDFRAAYLPAAERVLDSGTPYAKVSEDELEAGKGYVYPPLTSIALVPFTLVPVDVAALLAVLGSAAALLGALALVGVRDLRCYAALLVSVSAWNSLEMANVSAVLALGLALVWRYRKNANRAGPALGVVLATKAIFWPLLVWSAAIRRLRLAATAVGVGVLATVLSWAFVGFAGLAEYPELVRRITEIQGEQSYSFRGMGAALGIDVAVGQFVGVVVGVSLIALCVARAWRGDDLGSFTCAIVAGLALTPIVWQHYLVVLFIPLAIARPRFTWPWLLPVLPWLSPRAGHGDGLEPFVPALVVAAILVVVSQRPWSARWGARSPEAVT